MKQSFSKLGMLGALASLVLWAHPAFASVTRTIDADALISSDHTKTFSLPAVAGEIGLTSTAGVGVNLLVGTDNPSFESGSTPSQWTASGGSFTGITSTSALYGAQSGRFDASASSQTLSSNSKTITSGLQGANCLGAFSYKYSSGSNGDYSLQVYDGTNVVAALSLDVTSVVKDASVNFICPASGSLILRLISNVSNPGAIDVDGPSFSGGAAYIGSATNIREVNQSTFYGGLEYAGNSGCTFTSTSGSYANFSADTDCATPTTKGNAVAPGTKIPGVVFNNIPPGFYLVQISVFKSVSATDTFCNYTISDGTSRVGAARTIGTGLGGGGTDDHSLYGVFEYTTAQSSKTFQIQVMRVTGTGSCSLDMDSAAQEKDLQINVFRYPSVSNQALNIEQVPRISHAKFAGATNCNWDTTSGSFANFSTDADCSDPTLVGDATSAGKVPGLTRSQIPAGRYLVTATGDFSSIFSGSQTNCLFTISDGSTESGHTRIVAFSSADQGHFSGLTGVYSYTSVQSSRTFQIQALREAGSGTCRIGNGTGISFQMSVVPLDVTLPMPVVVNSVSTQNTGQVSINSAFVGSTGTIARQDGSWLTSVSHPGTGSYTLNITAGVFASTPNCVCSVDKDSVDTYCNVEATSTTAASVRTRTNAAGDADVEWNVICMGPR